MSSPYKIPLVDLRAQHGKLRSKIRQAIDEVVETQQFILGPAVTRFEEQMAAYLRSRFAVGVASGSDALLLALMALNIGPGDGVIVTPFTFFSTVSSITRLGATPFFVDIDPESYLISAEAAEECLDKRTRIEGDPSIDSTAGLRLKAILPVHLFGRSCDMAAFGSLAKKYHMRIVEDVAQGCGARTMIGSQAKNVTGAPQRCNARTARAFSWRFGSTRPTR